MNLDCLEGTVQSIRFQNPENGYTVLKLNASKKQHTAVGNMPGVNVGDEVRLQGYWTTHATHGEQMQVQLYERVMPEGSDAILKYLSSGSVSGVGKSVAKLIVAEFGGTSLDIIESDYTKLSTLKGISAKRAKQIHESYCEQIGSQRLVTFLTTHSLPLSLTPVLTQYYKERAIDVIEANPYLLTEEHFGVPFARVDPLALSMGFDTNSNLRLEAGLLSSLLKKTWDGHCYLPQDELLSIASNLLRCDEAKLKKALTSLEKRCEIVIETHKKVKFIYPIALYEAEEYVSMRLLELCQAELLPPDNLDELIQTIQEEQGICYSPEQKKAIELAAKHQVILISGGPGTGKTTSLKGVMSLLQSLNLDTSLTAPTGRAAQRLGELCDGEATTIHRLLEVTMNASGQQEFFRDEDEPLKADAVIVDEMSMVDISLMAGLLAALPNGCRLVLVGDPDQLPSVGPGCLFQDLIESEVIPMVQLARIFRQAQESNIVKNAHSINQGELPDIKSISGDFFFLPRWNSEMTVETIVDLCKNRLPEKMGIPTDKIQVLSPTRQRGTGTAALNKALQEALNPPSAKKGERSYGDWIFRVGDRVMQVKNNYDVKWSADGGDETGEGVFNGDIGQVVAANTQTVTVNFDGRVVEYSVDLLSQLEPAFAITVHKSQGSEYPAVILATLDGAPMLMTRKVLYTGLTRAKNLFIAVGSPDSFLSMTKNVHCDHRYSGLRGRLLQ